jgi:hypothetical protein
MGGDTNDNAEAAENQCTHTNADIPTDIKADGRSPQSGGDAYGETGRGGEGDREEERCRPEEETYSDGGSAEERTRPTYSSANNRCTVQWTDWSTY